LIGDMLDVSQLDLSAMDLRFAETTIESAVRMAVEPLHESIRNRKQSLTARGLRGLPPLEADVQRLVQAIRNVVLNAVKYTPDGGRIDIIGTLIANPVTGADEIQLEIRDNGIGIDPKNKEAIFDKFFRASDPGLHSTGTTKFMGAGPGLGLTIARGVIEGHGGRIGVESEAFDPDNLPGSTFYIVLPLTPPQGTRRVLPISSAGRHVGSTDPVDATDDDPFIEPDPTLLNPSAHRAGLTKAAMAAAEDARRQESNEPDS
jgi:signal transduction histidine kinase